MSIETAVQGGSISLLRGEKQLDCWIGTREVSKSEDVLEEISKILERNSSAKKSIKKVVVSRGPGSYTGVRIGIAIGMGLKKALDCELVGVSVFEAMRFIRSIKARARVGCADEILVAVPIGRNQICWQKFRVDNASDIDFKTQPQVSASDKFFDFFNKSEFQTKEMILHRKLYLEFQENYGNRLAKNYILSDAGENIAAHIGMRAAEMNVENEIFSPLYIKDDDFLVGFKK